MATSILISSLLYGEPVFGGLAMHGQRFVVDGNDNETLHQHETATLQTGGDLATYSQQATFNSLAPGTARFWIMHEGVILWRSGDVVLTDDDQLFRYTLYPMEGEETTYGESRLEDELELPIITSAEEGEDDPDEANTISAIEELTINIKSDHLRFNGEGYYGSRALYESEGGVDLLASNFQFEYKVRIEASKAPSAAHLLQVTPVEPIQIGFANPLVGFFALFLQQRINDDTREAIEADLNGRVQDEIEARVGAMTDDAALIARTTASVRKITIHFDVEEEDFLEFELILSIPTELVEESTSGGCSLGASVLVAAGALGVWQLVNWLG